MAEKIATALVHIHNLNIVHRDIKPENILLETTEDETSAKLTDFGLAKVMEGDWTEDRIIGTPHMLAPESLDGKYHKGVDCWALGAVTYAMLFGNPKGPFGYPYRDRIHEAIRSIIFPRESTEWLCLTPEARSFVEKLLCYKKQRYSAEKILNHPWIRNITLEEEKKQAAKEKLMTACDAKSIFGIAVAVAEAKRLGIDDDNKELVEAREMKEDLTQAARQLKEEKAEEEDEQPKTRRFMDDVSDY